MKFTNERLWQRFCQGQESKTILKQLFRNVTKNFFKHTRWTIEFEAFRIILDQFKETKILGW